MRRAEGRPVSLDRVAGLPLALRGSASPAPHIDHGGRLVEGAEFCLLSLWVGWCFFGGIETPIAKAGCWLEQRNCRLVLTMYRHKVGVGAVAK